MCCSHSLLLGELLRAEAGSSQLRDDLVDAAEVERMAEPRDGLDLVVHVDVVEFLLAPVRLEWISRTRKNKKSNT